MVARIGARTTANLRGAPKPNVAPLPIRNWGFDHETPATANENPETKLDDGQRSCGAASLVAVRGLDPLCLTMFRNQYDTDVTVWSPEGRLLQVRSPVARR